MLALALVYDFKSVDSHQTSLVAGALAFVLTFWLFGSQSFHSQ